MSSAIKTIVIKWVKQAQIKFKHSKHLVQYHLSTRYSLCLLKLICVSS